MQKLTYFFFRYLIIVFYFTPFWYLYLLSDIFAFILFYFIPYRKKVVLTNLKNSFPNKSNKEINKIAREFYKHLIDLIFESLKGYTLPFEKISKRYKIENPDLLYKFTEQGKDTIAAAGHYGNWEWGTIVLPQIINQDFKIIYKPLSNKYINDYLKKSRAKNKGELVSMKLTRRIFSHQKDKPLTAVMLGDQSPSNKKKAIWVNFLNQDTACIHGIEFYSKFFNTPVIFFNINKVKRGHYEVDYELLTDKPNELEEGKLTQMYMNLLEKCILKKPEYYLWSHKRWKHKR